MLSIAPLGQNFSDSGGQGGLAVVNVTDGTDVHVGLVTVICAEALELPDQGSSECCKGKRVLTSGMHGKVLLLGISKLTTLGYNQVL